MPIISGSSASGSGAISGVTVTGTAASGQVPVASSSSAGAWGYPPGFEIGYDQITAPVTIASSTEATGTAIITCAAHTFDGSPVIGHFFTPELITGTVAAVLIIISLFESATQIGRLLVVDTPGATQSAAPCAGFIRFTPTAASHTYTVTAIASSLTGSPSVGAEGSGTGTKVPAFMRFTKV
jgi:hypothetical protein